MAARFQIKINVKVNLSPLTTYTWEPKWVNLLAILNAHEQTILMRARAADEFSPDEFSAATLPSGNSYKKQDKTHTGPFIFADSLYQ